MPKGTLGALVILTLLLAPRPAMALHEQEVFRSAWGIGRDVEVNPSDNSVWAAIGSRVYHLAAGGTILSSTDFWMPHWLAVNPLDGSCWVVDFWPVEDPHAAYRYEQHVLIRLNAEGDPIASVSLGDERIAALAADPRDGTFWISADRLEHRSADGILLGSLDRSPRSLAVDPGDGSLWYIYLDSSLAPAPDRPTLVHAQPDGTELGRADLSSWTGGTPSLLLSSSIVVDPSDHSAWWGTCHFASDGTFLPPEIALPFDFSADANYRASRVPNDGSLWYSGFPGLAHMTTEGTALWAYQANHDDDYFSPGPSWLAITSVAATSDGSCWVTSQSGPEGFASLAHYGPNGTLLWRSDEALSGCMGAAVDGVDGSVWSADWWNSRLVHTDDEGNLLNQSGLHP